MPARYIPVLSWQNAAQSHDSKMKSRGSIRCDAMFFSTQLAPSRDPNCVGIPVVRQAPHDMKIATRLDFVKDRIVSGCVDPVLECQMCDASGFKVS